MSLTPPLSGSVAEDIQSWNQLPRQVVITADGAGTHALTESNGQLVAAQAGAFGNLRMGYLTQWRAADSDIISLWGPPSTFTTTPSTNKPQIGHLHRVSLMPDQRSYQAIAVFHDAFLGAPHQLHCEAVTFDGVTLTQINDQVLSQTLTKALRVWWARRFTFGSQFAEYISEPRSMRLIEDGDIVRVQNMPVTGFNTPASGMPVTNSVPDQGFFRLTYPGVNESDGLGGGDVTWVDTTNTAKNLMPYYVRSQVVGNRLRVKQWIHGEPEPRTWGLDIALTDARTPLADGWNGVWVGHVQSGSSHKFRDLRITRLR